jgi:HAD superfamily phosphatase (TIGR01668 family)
MDIKNSFLLKEKIKFIIFDADATLVQAKSNTINKDIVEKIESFKAQGLKIAIASNGNANRIKEIFKGHNIEAYGMSFKPLPFRLKKLISGYNKDEILIVGDQLFTDILCGNLLGIKSLMVDAYGNDIGFGIGIKRSLEKMILKHHK